MTLVFTVRHERTDKLGDFWVVEDRTQKVGPTTAPPARNAVSNTVPKTRPGTIPIPPALVRLLRAHLKRHGTTPDGWIFQTARGGIVQDSA